MGDRPDWAEGALAQARAAWPMLAVDETAYLAHVSRCAERTQRSIDELNAADLWLAFACAQGSPQAADEFDRMFRAQLIAALHQIFEAQADVDDAAQRLRERLLVGPPPKLLDYTGSGPLGGWLRVAALRTALNDERSKKARARAERGAVAEQWGALDPELELLRRRYLNELEQALKVALSQLDPEQRHLLRMHYIDGVALAQLARMHQLDASTMSRRVTRARELVLSETRRELQRELNLSPETAASLIRLLESRIELTLSGLKSRR